ncbi:DoxX family protein [Chitinophaga caeni]|uniref:DoxX family protein n=2 Tax=Chitinophaga caeni TaxID=2029983 RepID=A0A291R0U7_9BACT|nr:DoxX family protein [Chitinophaga caeni]
MKDWPLLILRLVLAFGFFWPAQLKWSNIQGVIDNFSNLGVPLPTISAYFVAGIEAIGVIFLALGLATRIVTIPLMIIMLVAINVVHWQNGFPVANGGFEIPLYYLVMLFVLLIYGPGKFSIDHLVNRNKRRSPNLR